MQMDLNDLGNFIPRKENKKKNHFFSVRQDKGG